MPESARVIDITEVDQNIEKKALQIIDIKSVIAVVDNDSMALADELKKKCREVIKLIDEDYQPLAKSAFDHHRNVTAKWNAKKKPYQDFEATLTNQVKAYLRKIREEEEREAERLRQIARQQAEEEQLRQAIEAEQSGNMDEATEILQSEPVYIAPVPVSNIPKVDGRLYKTTIKMRVTDRMAFLKAATPELLAEIIPDSAWPSIENKLSMKARALGKRFCPPGTEQYEA